MKKKNLRFYDYRMFAVSWKKGKNIANFAVCGIMTLTLNVRSTTDAHFVRGRKASRWLASTATQTCEKNLGSMIG